MQKKQTKNPKVVVAIAEDLDWAKKFQNILRKKGISATIGRRKSPSSPRNITIEVLPQDYDQAYVLIAQNRTFDPLEDIFLDCDHNCDEGDSSKNPYRAA